MVTPIKMNKDLMKQRIQEALASGSVELAKQRVEVCLWGLDKVKGGAQLANELIDELGLAQYGQAKRPVEA